MIILFASGHPFVVFSIYQISFLFPIFSILEYEISEEKTRKWVMNKKYVHNFYVLALNMYQYPDKRYYVDKNWLFRMLDKESIQNQLDENKLQLQYQCLMVFSLYKSINGKTIKTDYSSCNIFCTPLHIKWIHLFTYFSAYFQYGINLWILRCM